MASLKKTTRYAEIFHKERLCYIRQLREWIQAHGSHNIVYFDESGFEAQSYRTHGWAPRGVKVHGKVTGNKHRGRVNLIMAQRGKEWLAPMLFEKSCTHEVVTAWIKQALIKELRPGSLVIMDNAPFHNKVDIEDILTQHGHTLMTLPKYSPDLNPIEQTFAIIKRRRKFKNQTIQKLLC